MSTTEYAAYIYGLQSGIISALQGNYPADIAYLLNTLQWELIRLMKGGIAIPE